MIACLGWLALDVCLVGVALFGFAIVGEFGGLRLWLATFGLCALGFDLVVWVVGFAFGWLWWFVYLAGLRFGCWCLTGFVVWLATFGC